MNAKKIPQADDSGKPTLPQADDLPDDPRLLQAVQEYLAQLEGGSPPNREELLRRYADIAEPLARCLDGLELVHKTAPMGPARRGRQSPGNGPLATDTPGAPLGDFQIVREIGRGGMGIVYEAVQLSLGRRVALKVLSFAAAFDSRQLQRFHNEAQAAAQLHHTNIVPVYAVGCERGVHFYAMQLIEGQSLATVVRQLRQQTRPAADEAGGPAAAPPVVTDMLTTSFSPSLPPNEEAAVEETPSPMALALSTHRSHKDREFFRAAARFIVQAAGALEHAHQFGIVHRDIKPANLLVDTHGRLWITDFGLALFHADVGLTQTGDILGTLRYMSPEQASGQRVLLDHRTDIYSLGATLYELVALEPIFPGQNRQVLLYQIINEEPRPPRSLDKTLPIELETIILKAVSKSPGDRYGSARAFADDLRRYLEDKPILAKRPSLIERVRKWARRHPEIVTAGVLLLLVGLVGLFISNRMIAKEKDRTQQRAAEAERRFRQARRAVDLLVQVCEEELADMPPHLQGVRPRLLAAALEYYQDFIKLEEGNAEVQASLEEGRNRVRRILNELSTLQGSYQLVVMKAPDVQDALKLSDEQRERIGQLSKQWSEQFLANFRNRKRLSALAEENETALAAILDKRQLKRLGQITLQNQGTLPFHESRVIDALRLTAEQQQRIRAIEGSMFFMRQPPPGPPDRPKEGPLRQAVERIVQEVLTEEQQARWQELIGEPFLGKVHDPPPPAPHPPPPPPRGRRGPR
jgi:hypothetical protein